MAMRGNRAARWLRARRLGLTIAASCIGAPAVAVLRYVHPDTFAMFGRCHVSPAIDIALRCLLAAVAFLAMFHPDMKVSAAVSVVVAAALVFGIWRHRQVAPPKSFALTEDQIARSGDLSPVLAEAKRDIG